METIMPRKTKSTTKPKAKTKAAKAKRYGRDHKITLKQRKRIITDTLEAIVTSTDPKDQCEITTHVLDVGIELMGVVHGLDVSNAMILVPTDPFTRLLNVLAQHEQVTGEPSEITVAQLIEYMTKRLTPEVLMN